MKRLIDGIRSLYAPFAIGLLLLTAAFRADAQLYCNNPVAPCNPDDPQSVCYRPASPSPRCEPKECGKCAKSPCYVGSGVYSTEATDLEIRTVGFPISVSRLYESSRAVDGEMGVGWVTGLSARIYLTMVLKDTLAEGDNEAYVRLPSGTLYRFVEDAFGNYVPPPGRFDRLIHNADGTWELRLQRTRSVYRYAATGELTGMTDDSGNSLVWSYEKGRLTRIAYNPGGDPKSLGLRYVELAWGGDGRLSDVTDHTGRSVHYDYDSAGRLAGVTNPLGQTTRYEYAAGRSGPLLRAIDDHWNRNVTTVTYDANDRVKTYTDRGETYTYTYAYQGQSRVTAKSDSSGNTWVYTFTPEGLVTDIQPPGGGASEHVDYDANGLPVLEIDATGVKTRYEYDARGNFATVTRDYQGPTAVEWRFAYHPDFPDEPVSILPYSPSTGQISPDWQGVRFEYHPLGSVSEGLLQRLYAVDAGGATARLVAAFTWDSQGRLHTETDAGGNVRTETYGELGERTILMPANNDAGTRPVIRYSYDALGRVESVTDPLGNVTVTAWDELDRLAAVTLPKPFPGSALTFTTTYRYDRYEPSSQLLYADVVDANGRIIQVGADQYGRTVRTIDPAGAVQRNVFDKALLSAVVDANDYSTSYQWDSHRRLATVIHPDGTAEHFTHYADGTIASHRDRADRTTAFTYDHHKRLATRTYPAGSVTMTYEGQKLRWVVDTSVSPAETHELVYDSAFRLQTSIQGTRGNVSHTYRPDGRLATVSSGSGATTTYDYYPSGDVRTIAWTPVSGVFRYDYSLAGRVSLITFPNGQMRAYTHDAQGRLTQIANTHPSAGTLASFAYGYDVDPYSGGAIRLGMRTSVTATVPALGATAALSTFGYDDRSFLTQGNYSAGPPYAGRSGAWTYDLAGHRTTATVGGNTTAYVYNKFGGNVRNSAQLQSDGANAYAYDSEGNVVSRSGSRGNFTFAWDFDNRLRSVSGDVAATYGYDYNGRRATSVVNGSATSYLYSGDDVIAENGAASAEYLHGPGLDQPLAMSRGGQIHYYAVDGQDSVATLNDAAGTVVNAYAWDVWGEEIARVESVPSSLGYTARERAVAGLQYSRFRHYEAAVARFASEDPLQEYLPIVGGELYGYVRNAPLDYTDPYGLRCESTVERGPWYLAGEDDWYERWVLISTREFWSVPRVPLIRGGRIPTVFGSGTRYYCYWSRYFVAISHYERHVVARMACDCPTESFQFSYKEKKDGYYRKRLETTATTTVNTPCWLSPPK